MKENIEAKQTISNGADMEHDIAMRNTTITDNHSSSSFNLKTCNHVSPPLLDHRAWADTPEQLNTTQQPEYSVDLTLVQVPYSDQQNGIQCLESRNGPGLK